MAVSFPEPDEAPEPEAEPSGDIPPPRPPRRTAVGTGGSDEPPTEGEMIRMLVEMRERELLLRRLHDVLQDLLMRRIE